MVNRVSLLVEIMSIIVCLYALYGEKYRFGYKEIILISVDIILMQSIDGGYLPDKFKPTIYLAIAIYSIWNFGNRIRQLIVNNILYIILLGGLQMFSFVLISWIVGEDVVEEIRILSVNIVMLLGCIIVIRKKWLRQVSYYFQRDDVIMWSVLVMGSLVILSCIYMVRYSKGLYVDEYIIQAIAILIICVMAGSWQKYKLKAKEKENELRMYKLYEASCQNLISEIRLRQHEFNNHINAIYSQHLTCRSYEELVAQQRTYCEEIIYDNRYEKILKAGDFALIGFLYGKFMEAEKRGIRVEYELKCIELISSLPMFKLIELIGNLIDNAIDATENCKEKRLYVSIIENVEEITIEVRNVHPTLSSKEITAMFQKGYSSKGEDRGLGLYGIKRMGLEYHFDIICSNVLIDNRNWVSFSIHLKNNDQ
ncbi:MAG: GHKL domain-containing protein [Lachnospiraceae bacterium]|nr:GHKL domain-containing protein [Lachnospiraceae bacterium]